MTKNEMAIFISTVLPDAYQVDPFVYAEAMGNDVSIYKCKLSGNLFEGVWGDNRRCRTVCGYRLTVLEEV